MQIIIYNFATRKKSIPQICRITPILSQQVEEESARFLGIWQKSPYLCDGFKFHTLVRASFFILHNVIGLLLVVAYKVRWDSEPFCCLGHRESLHHTDREPAHFEQAPFFLIPHTRGRTQCREDRSGDRHDDLQRPFQDFFLLHIHLKVLMVKLLL